MSAEHNYLNYLRVADELTVLIQQVGYYKEKHGREPQLMIVNRRCLAAVAAIFVKELSVPAHAALVQPLWLNSIPILFRPMKEGEYIACLDNSRGIKEVL